MSRCRGVDASIDTAVSCKQGLSFKASSCTQSGGGKVTSQLPSIICYQEKKKHSSSRKRASQKRRHRTPQATARKTLQDPHSHLMACCSRRLRRLTSPFNVLVVEIEGSVSIAVSRGKSSVNTKRRSQHHRSHAAVSGAVSAKRAQHAHMVRDTSTTAIPTATAPNATVEATVEQATIHEMIRLRRYILSRYLYRVAQFSLLNLVQRKYLVHA